MEAKNLLKKNSFDNGDDVIDHYGNPIMQEN
jgi:hypothetical protein